MKEKYIKAFINEKEINKKQFSILGLLLGPILLLYNKMFIPSIILLTLVGITSYINLELAILLEIVIHLIIGFKYNIMYLNHVNKKVDEIIISNSDKEEKEILRICKRKGKPFTPIIIIICIIIIGISIIPLFLKKEEKQKIGKQKINDLIYTIPNQYQLGKHQSSNYHHYYHIDKNNNCEITITTHNNKKIDQLLITSSKETLKINNNSFIYQNKDNTDYYLIENNNIIYKILFKIKKDKTCQSEKEEFLSSLSFQ